MAKRDISRFPTTFERLTRAALQRAESVTLASEEALISIPLKTRGECVNLQMQLRQYWNILTDMAEGGLLHTVAGVSDIAPKVSQLACRYKRGDMTVLEVIHRAQTISSMRIAAALDALGETVAGIAGPDPNAPPITTRLPAVGPSPLEEEIRRSFPSADGDTPRTK